MLSSVTFTFITLFSSGLTVLIALISLIILLIQLKRQKNVSLLLIINTYAAMIVFAAVLLSTTINVLEADLYGFTNLTGSELTGCRFRGFMIYESFGCFYMTFVLQAWHRLVRVVYPRRKQIQNFAHNLLRIVLLWIVSFLFLLPSYLWPGQQLFSFYESAYYCGILYDRIAGLSYTMLHIYILPVLYSTGIYARLLYFLHHQPPQLSRMQQIRRAQRDFIVIQRILFTVIILTLPGLPNIGFILMVNIDDRYAGAFFMYRIQWMGPSVAIFVLSIALIFINPQVKEIFMNLISRGNRVAPIAIAVRTIQPTNDAMEPKL